MSNLIYTKMSLVMKDIGSVGKDQKNQAQGFKFRGIDQFVNSLHPALTKHGVFVTPRCVRAEHELKTVVRSSGKEGTDKHVSILMEYDFYAEDGSKVTVGPIPAEGLDSGDKATNKALSAALKYALIQTFSIPTEDMAEGDLETPVIAQPKTPGPTFIYDTELKKPNIQDVQLNAGGTATLVVKTRPLNVPITNEMNLIEATEAPKPLDLTETKKSSFRKPRATKTETPVTTPVLGNGSTKEEDFFG